MFFQLAEVLPPYPNQTWVLAKQLGCTHAVSSVPPDPDGRPTPDFMALLRQKERFKDAGLELAGEAHGDYGFESGVAAGGQLLDLSPRPTAIFAASDVMAAGVLKAAAARGLTVPDDLSVVGFDGGMFAQMLSPALTSVQRPMGDIAEAGTSRLIDLVERLAKRRQEGLAHLRQLEAARIADEQLASDVVLERANMGGNGRLGVSQFLGGHGEAEVACRAFERANVIEGGWRLHGSIPSFNSL